MEKYNFVFIVLTYRNAEDLCEFNYSLKNIVGTYKIIVVNSYYDDNSMLNIKNICDYNGFDFLNVINKGYSFGNNQGIEYANKNYAYNYIIISNPDIEIQKLDYNSLLLHGGNIIGPKIITSTGRNQNPIYYTRQRMIEQIQMEAIKRKKFYINYIAALINKINKAYNTIVNNNNLKYRYVYALHGSFLIFSKASMDKLRNKPFDDRMFLFAEEDYLAYISEKMKIQMIYDKGIIVKHKEDGSMRLSNIDLRMTALKSLEYVYILKIDES